MSRNSWQVGRLPRSSALRHEVLDSVRFHRWSSASRPSTTAWVDARDRLRGGGPPVGAATCAGGRSKLGAPPAFQATHAVSRASSFRTASANLAPLCGVTFSCAYTPCSSCSMSAFCSALSSAFSSLPTTGLRAKWNRMRHCTRKLRRKAGSCSCRWISRLLVRYLTLPPAQRPLCAPAASGCASNAPSTVRSPAANSAQLTDSSAARGFWKCFCRPQKVR
mmetsp:Transcript_39788/g.101745  ORF Transcript_39788/g.101745 Transcript_39788/m.101745 type:complete len:221 (+) Transcript_39788:430-1092(+)